MNRRAHHIQKKPGTGKEKPMPAANGSCTEPEAEAFLPALVMPPGCDTPPEYKALLTYYRGKARPAPPPVPKRQARAASSDARPAASGDLAAFLEAYKDTCICLEYMGCESARAETCGVLKAVGREFLVLEDPDAPNLIIADLRQVRQIRLFCRKA